VFCLLFQLVAAIALETIVNPTQLVLECGKFLP